MRFIDIIQGDPNEFEYEDPRLPDKTKITNTRGYVKLRDRIKNFMAAGENLIAWRDENYDPEDLEFVEDYDETDAVNQIFDEESTYNKALKKAKTKKEVKDNEKPEEKNQIMEETE